MPTIDQLQSAIVCSDDDVLPVSQNGIARRVTRSQLLEGTQASLAFTPGLVGRVSPGLGPPQQIILGGGLSLSAGVLSGAPQYTAASLPLSTSAVLTDLVPTLQNGQDHAVSIKTLLSTAGIDVSNQLARTDLGITRRLADWLGDAVAVEAFGALGDGVSDDTGAINLAIASGRPVLFGPKTYRVDGQWNAQATATLIGTAGLTVLRRISQRGGAWINVTAPAFASVGIMFDAGNVDADSWGVLIAPSCTQAIFRDCSFINATGATLGNGLTIQARDGVAGHLSSHSVTSCSFYNNKCHGIWVQAASGASIRDCQAAHNGGFGICLDFNDPLFQQTIRQSSVTGSKCWNNSRGISIGNYNASNSEPPRWGLDNPDATDITVSGNICSGNSTYGIAVSGARIQVLQNQIIIDDQTATASGMLCNASFATIASNSIVGPGQFGIDAGGSADTMITSNVVSNCAMGINAGGSVRVRVAQNHLIYNNRAITLFQMETDGQGVNFGLPCSDIWIEDNIIQLEAGHGGIFLVDGPERVAIERNQFISSVASTLGDLCWAHTDTVTIHQNTWNGSSSINVGANIDSSTTEVVVPDVLDEAVIASSTTQIDAVFGLHQLTMSGQISFVRVNNGGVGYSQAKVVIAGSGFGATATAYLSKGVVIGIALTSGGSGYDPATVSGYIIGDGVGAVLQPFVGLPVPQDRRLSLRCLSPVRFTQGRTNGYQSNWTGTDITVAAGSKVELQGVDGAWQVVSFTNLDYVQPGGDGSVSIRSARGDIRLSAGTGGGVRFRSDNEQAGFLTYFGRGSPEGTVSAPPGSDYRNLSGGIGATLWLKRVGTDSSGWFPVA